MSAKSKPSAIVSGAGWIGGFAYLLERALRAKGWTRDQIHALVIEGDPADQPIDRIADMLVGKVVGPVIQIAWELVLNWVIAACRFVTYVDPAITAENFPFVVGCFDVLDVVVVAIPRQMTTAEVLKFLDEQGFRPANLIELLFWWLTHSAEQGNCLVVALGQLFRGNAPYVHGYGDNRKLGLHRVGGGWDRGYGFAAVRKSAAPAA